MPGKKRSQSSSSSDSNVSEQWEHGFVNQPPRERVITFKNESWVENEIEHAVLIDSPQPRTNEFSEQTVSSADCPGSSVGQQLKRRSSRSKRVLSKVSKPSGKYFKGCLVMARVEGFPFWPGMIRNAGTDYKDDIMKGYYCNSASEGETLYFVQLFDDPTSWKWLTTKDLRVFDAAKPNRCNDSDPSLVQKFSKGMQIAKAALNFLEARLAKFTLFNGTPIDNLLKDIDEMNSGHKSGTVSVAEEVNDDAPPAQEHSESYPPAVAQNVDESAPSTQENDGIHSDSVTQNETECAPAPHGTRESSPDPIEIAKQRIFDFKQKLLDECNLQKNKVTNLKEENEKLEAENKKLIGIVDRQAKAIANLHENMKQEELEHKKEVEAEKLKYMEKLEKWKELVDKMFW